MLKKGYEFGFAWIFTMFVGAAVIAFAIFAANRIIETRQFEQQSLGAKEIGVLLTPVETKLAEGKFSRLLVRDETKINNTCKTPNINLDPFGSQGISISIKPRLGAEWQELEGVQSTFHNKYIFSSKEIQGEDEFFVLAKPIKIPFKVADAIMIWGEDEEFCFRGAPPPIQNELIDLRMENVVIEGNPPGTNCDSSKQKIVCFPGTNCDIGVQLLSTGGFVKHRNSNPTPFINSFGSDQYGMMYAAIFSDQAIYDCQIRRIMAHTSYLSEVYIGKSSYFSTPDASYPSYIECSSTIQAPLENLRDATSPTSFTLSSLNNIRTRAQEVEDKNVPLKCRLY